MLLLGLVPAPPAAAQQRDRPRPEPPRAGNDAPSPGAGAGGTVAGGVAAYHDALEVLASGSTADAVRLLAASEAAMAVEPGSGVARATERAQMDLLAALAGRDVEALLPVLVMHLHLFRVHNGRREYVAAGRHAALIERAALLYARGTPRHQGDRVAAEILTVLGAGLVDGGLRRDARHILTEALDLSPVQPEALLVLAAERERAGAYEEAVGFLRRLSMVRAGWLEARVRLAVNLARTGATGEAAERFEAMCGDAAAGWAAILSCEELARMRLAAGDAAAAERILRAAIERFPDAERLRLALAFAVDRGGDPAAARALVEALAERPAGGGETPRQRYNRGTDPDHVVQLSTRLQARAAERVANLRAVIDAMAAEGWPT